MQMLLQDTAQPLPLKALASIVRFLVELGERPCGDPFATCRWLAVRLDEMFRGDGTSFGFAVRKGVATTARHPGRVLGWSPAFFLYAADRARRREQLADLMRGRDFALDKAMNDKMRDAGRRRVYVARDFDERAPKPRGFEGQVFARLGLNDRAVGHVPLAADVEGLVLVDRRAPPVFSVPDGGLLLALLPALAAPLRDLARACGYVDALEPLTPRERDVTRLLLTGARERDIAAALATTPTALHQRVKDVYRKFRVTSRSEMMALWLHGGKTTGPSG